MTNAIGVAKTTIANRPIVSGAAQAPSQTTLGFVPLPPSASVQTQHPTQPEPYPPLAQCSTGYARWEVYSRRRRRRRVFSRRRRLRDDGGLGSLGDKGKFTTAGSESSLIISTRRVYLAKSGKKHPQFSRSIVPARLELPEFSSLDIIAILA